MLDKCIIGWYNKGNQMKERYLKMKTRKDYESKGIIMTTDLGLEHSLVVCFWKYYDAKQFNLCDSCFNCYKRHTRV
jgi:hypothetical protein